MFMVIYATVSRGVPLMEWINKLCQNQLPKFCASTFIHRPIQMPRKAASTESAEPRRSSRIKELPKPDPPKKAPAKPRAKKGTAKTASKTPATGEEGTEPEQAAAKPKARGKKRTAEEANGPEEGSEKHPAKKVCWFLGFECATHVWLSLFLSLWGSVLCLS
jgi:hypothetical protein